MYATQKGINEILDTIVNLEELFINVALQSSNKHIYVYHNVFKESNLSNNYKISHGSK